MKSSIAQKSKKSCCPKSKELKEALCDIVNTLNGFVKTDKKLEELANYCSGEKRVRSETSR